MAQIGETLRQDAVAVIFVNVFLQQIGLPVPAVPTLLLAGSLMATPGDRKVLAAAIVASVIADWTASVGQTFRLPGVVGLVQALHQPRLLRQPDRGALHSLGRAITCRGQFYSRLLDGGTADCRRAAHEPAGVSPGRRAGAGLWAGLALGAGWMLKDTVLATITFLEQHAGNVC